MFIDREELVSNRNATINFDIRIERQGQEYRTLASSPLCGEGSERFTLPFDEAEVMVLLASFDRAAYKLQSFGQRLFDALFVGEVRDCWQNSVSAAAQQSAALRIRLNLSDTPELVKLPWEYLYDSATNRFLAQTVQTPLVRYLDLPKPIPVLAAPSPLCILVLIASPSDLQTLDVEREWNNLKSAMADLEARGTIVVERLDDATLVTLQKKLRRQHYHILHFIGHGAFDEDRQEGVLVLEDKTGKGQMMTGKTLGVLLHNYPSLRLVVLNSCDGARAVATNAFAGVAQQLVQQEVPAVIAMQFALSDEAANHFSHTFYAALADHYGVDSALTEARVAMAAEDGNAEWGAPVLYLRAPDAHLFAAPQPLDSAMRWHRQGAFWLGAGLLGLILLIGLGYLLLRDAPALQTTLGIMGSLLLLLLSWLGLREDKTLAARLSRWIGVQPFVQAGLGLALALSLGFWGWVGIPIGRDLICGPLGCPSPGVQRLALGEWKNLTPGVSKFEFEWTQETQDMLYAKLRQVEQLQIINQNNELAITDVNQYLDFWIDGDFRKRDQVQLTAKLTGKGGADKGRIAVQGIVDEERDSSTVRAQIAELQNQLVGEILRSLGIQVTAAISTAIRNTPTSNPEALRLNNEGAAYYGQGDLRTAESLLRAAVALDAEYADAHNNLANVLAGRGEITAALASVQQAIDLSPRNPLYWFNLAEIYETAGDRAAAAPAYEEAIAIDPAFVRAYNNLGLLLLQQGQIEKAEAILQRGLLIQATRPSLHKNLGRVYLAQAKLPEAIRELQRSIELSSPQNPDLVYYDALYYLAVAQEAAGQRTAACAALDDYRRQADDDEDHTRIEGAQQLRTKLACP